ncbi:hypothetical protein CAPTEDRAFT_102441, partial [Capitella teleta]
LPKLWKDAVVAPQPKKGCRQVSANCRPISLTCILCKVMESIIRSQVTSHLDANSII